MMPAKRAKVNIPTIIKTLPMTRPSGLIGLMSPKPTVVKVTKAHHNPSTSSLMLGLRRCSTKNIEVPPTNVETPKRAKPSR